MGYDTFVPHGYALAQVAYSVQENPPTVKMSRDLANKLEYNLVDWLGQQNWSNANVGLMGNYMQEQQIGKQRNPSPHLKTIVPTWVNGVQEMFYRNGSSEARAFGYDAAYQAATADLTQDDLRVCSDDLVGP